MRVIVHPTVTDEVCCGQNLRVELVDGASCEQYGENITVGAYALVALYFVCSEGSG